MQTRGFVTGHDFSRADKANKINRALAPAEAKRANLADISSLFQGLNAASTWRAFTGCGKTQFLRLCVKARLLACPERSRRMPMKPIKSLGFSPCGMFFGAIPLKSSLFSQPV
jgi:hypothetical protein